MSENLIPVAYIGKKARKVDTVAGTGLEWARGQIHYVPPLVAQKLLRHPDVWAEDYDGAEADPARVGLVVTPDTGVSDAVTVPGKKSDQDEGRLPFGLPNLQGMTKGDLQTFSASQFNHQLDAGLKKDDMILQIVNLANSRAAGELT